MVEDSIEEEQINQTHKMPVEHQTRANLIVGKQKVNTVKSNSKAINKGKTINNKKSKAKQTMLELWEAITRRTVSMENSSTAEVLGIGSVDLKFPSGRILSLKRVHHVPTVRRNIISGSVIVRVPLQRNTSTPFELWKGIPSSVSLDDSLISTSIPEHVEKMTNVGLNPNSTSLTHEESDRPRELVANGFKQKEGMDYFDTYSPVARLTTILMLIVLVSVYNLPIHQMDIKTTFLYGKLEDEIYMDQPEGFVAHDNEHKVCKLAKSLYGLKQAPK
ncbi:UNVERIFIED_CONTAM: Retrovirus-related Pol polyprotein from transposon TNT 1-94 [Sesamum calycinum]|uniref:Retrovirus-related Pol polyprotein from transposon TNT 1-94 n=1 Tax=Sesamum calycinum TaxID=2727403 RepID=A0AAW2N222_9LAMI